MCDFPEGQKYVLTTETKCNKSVLFVKLTDSALHSIERFLQSKGDSSVRKPTIQFIDNNGTITFPINGQKINYGFTLSNAAPDGSSFQCLQHTEKKSLKSLGPIHKKMHIHANEDSYANTKCKMAAVEQEQKSLCTKEIKSNGSLLSHKKKIKYSSSIYPTKISSLSNNLNQSGFQKPRDKVSDLTLMKQPIRKRIIHILAIKPYKKPDVLLRLIKEGIHDQDKKSVPNILEQVASLKGNMYTLSSHLWKEVEDNWRFCTKEELKLIQRKKQQILKSNNEVSESVPQNFINGDVDNIPVFKEPPSKKARISHYNNHKVPGQTVKVNLSDFKYTPRILKQTRVENQQKVPLSKPVNGVLKGAYKANGKVLSAHFNLNKINGKECNVSSPFKSHVSNFDTASSESKQKYHKITSKEQRARYALDFNVQYVEYIELHTKMKDISERLASLENHLHNCEEGTEEFKKTRLEIHKIYKSTLQSKHYIKDWEKFNTLQSNLSLIKNLIIEYDKEIS